jgi:hypothetical protein
MGQEPPGSGEPAGGRVPGAPDDPWPAGFPGFWPDQDPGKPAPPWLHDPHEQVTAATASYLDAARPPAPDTLDTFPPRGRRHKTRLLTVTTLVAVALLCAVAVLVSLHPGGKAGRTPSPVPAGSGPGRSRVTSSTGGSLGVGGTPPGAGSISTALIFPRASVAAGGLPFGRVIAVLNKQCARAARGAFAAALDSAGCQRVVRATYVDSAKRYAVTAGVAQLPSPAAASQANRGTRFGPDIWFTGLDGPHRSGATAVSTSVGFGYDVVYGRYIIYALATYSSGRNPTGHAAEVRALQTLSQAFTALARQPLLGPGR